MIAFCDLPDDERFRLRCAITNNGGYVEGYYDNDVQVAMPKDWKQFLDAMRAVGLHRTPGSGYYFPLGSDNPADNLRHDGSHPGSNGFWFYTRLCVAELADTTNLSPQGESQ